MNASDIGLQFRALDKDGNEIRGMHHERVEKYQMVVVETGQVLQEWCPNPELISEPAPAPAPASTAPKTNNKIA